MKAARFTVGGVGTLTLIALASALVSIRPYTRRPVTSSGNELPRPAPNPSPREVRFAAECPTQFPPEHQGRCDFSAYRPMRISDWLPRGILTSVKPEYPPQAKLNHISGTVNVFVLINKEGRVHRVCSIGPKELRAAAEAAAVEWRFRRPTINGGVDPFGYIQETLVFRFVL